MKNHTSSSHPLALALGLSLLAAAPLGALQVRATETRTNALPHPELSMLKDASGYALHVRYSRAGAPGEFWLGTQMAAAPQLPGIQAMVVPLVSQPFVLGPMQDGVANAYLRLPITLATVGASFYAQGVVFEATVPGGMVPTPAQTVTLEPDDDAATCPIEEGLVYSTSSGNGAVQLGGLTSSQLVPYFAGSDEVQAEAAYGELYRLGKPSIQALLTLANDPSSAATAWAGDYAFEAESSSFLRFQGSAEISVRRMALYLISAIAMGTPTPYGVNELQTPSGQTSPTEDLDQLALDEVNAWWLSSAQKTLAELRSEARPLGRGAVDFGLAQAPALSLQGSTPGTETPINRNAGGAFVNVTMAEQFFVENAVTAQTKKAAFNCLSWAVHCDNCHGWVQPCKNTGAAIDAWMMMNGWSTTPPAGGARQTVMIQKQDNLPPLLPGSTWVHAMKKMPNCTWSSKNGAGGLYFGITDPMAFGNMSYPAPPATMNTFQNWYK